jgi:hypothetical protein
MLSNISTFYFEIAMFWFFTTIIGPPNNTSKYDKSAIHKTFTIWSSLWGIPQVHNVYYNWKL